MKTPINILVAALTLATGCGVGNPSKGQKVGQIVRVEESGVIWKTWEAQLIRGGFNGGSGLMGAPFDFTIERKEDAIKAQTYMEKQTEVVLSYRSEGIYSVTRTDSNGKFLEAIEPAAK